MVGLDRASLRWMHGFGACSFATDLWEASRLRIPVLAEYLSQMAATRWGATHRRYLQQGAAPAGESPIYPDSFNLFGFDGQGGACALLVNLPEARRIRLRPRDVVFWERVTGHLGAGLRLLRAAEQGATRLDDAEAIFDGQLRAVHASGPASSSASRAGLARVARLFDEARARRVEGREKLELWRALNQGRWSVLEEFDSDGRRFIVARPNAPRPDPQQGLTERESQVAALLVAGHSNKLIAYELGVSSSTVSTHVTAIAAKLGTKTRIQLIQALRARGTA